MISAKTGPSFDEPRTLAEQLEASLWLYRDTPEAEERRERLHVELELMFLRKADTR